MNRLGKNILPPVRTFTCSTLVMLSMCFQIIPLGCIGVPQVEPQLAEQSDNFDGTVTFAPDKLTPFTLKGIEPDFGDYTARGEVVFRQGDASGKLIGDGVAVFKTPSGDQIVAVVTWRAGPEVDGNRDSDITFSWRDSVQFSDGTVETSTGRFADPDARPRGLVVIAIIAVLIGLLLPAVQKVR